MKDAFCELLLLLRQLDEARISYKLRHSRDDAISVDVAVPGERWEIEFVDYGTEVQIEVERFVSDGVIADKSALKDLFAKFSDSPDEIPISVGVDANAHSPGYQAATSK